MLSEFARTCMQLRQSVVFKELGLSFCQALYIFLKDFIDVLLIKNNLESFLSAIENEYNGPEMVDGKVTIEFMKQLMELYKNQGKLHRKYAYKVRMKIVISLSIFYFCLLIHKSKTKLIKYSLH